MFREELVKIVYVGTNRATPDCTFALNDVLRAIKVSPRPVYQNGAPKS